MVQTRQLHLGRTSYTIHTAVGTLEPPILSYTTHTPSLGSPVDNTITRTQVLPMVLPGYRTIWPYVLYIVLSMPYARVRSSVSMLKFENLQLHMVLYIWYLQIEVYSCSTCRQRYSCIPSTAVLNLVSKFSKFSMHMLQLSTVLAGIATIGLRFMSSLWLLQQLPHPLVV